MIRNTFLSLAFMVLGACEQTAAPTAADDQRYSRAMEEVEAGQLRTDAAEANKVDRRRAARDTAKNAALPASGEQ